MRSFGAIAYANSALSGWLRTPLGLSGLALSLHAVDLPLSLTLVLAVLPLLALFGWLPKSIKPWWLQAAAMVLSAIFVLLFRNDWILLSLAFLFTATQLKSLQMPHSIGLPILNLMAGLLSLLTSQTVLHTGALLIFVTVWLWHLRNLQLKDHVLPIQFSMGNLSAIASCALVTMALFILVPRIGPLWQLPNAKKATVGLSDDVDPFQIGELVKDDRLAFRAEFHAPPLEKIVYWRALVQHDFTGKKWLNQHDYRRAIPNPGTLTQTDIEVYLEPSFVKTAFVPGPVLAAGQVRWRNFNQLETNQPVTGKFSYQLQWQAQPAPEPRPRALDTAINPKFAPKTQLLAQRLAQASHSATEFASQLNQWFVSEQFRYTLTPPILKSDTPVDEFLFDSKKGFCGHFASAAAALFRYAGYPARVVGGYLSPYNSQDPWQNVYQRDAHAWVEYYDEGWHRYDATTVVAPERLSTEWANSPELNALYDFDLDLAQSFEFLRLLSQWHDKIDFAWTKWVVNFDDGKQQRLLPEGWSLDKAIQVALAIGGVSLLAIFALLTTRRKHHAQDEIAKAIEKLFRRLELTPELHCSVVSVLSDYHQHLLHQNWSEQKLQPLLQLIEIYQTLRFKVSTPTAQQLATFKRLCHQCYDLHVVD